jgi:hypothetical protein
MDASQNDIFEETAAVFEVLHGSGPFSADFLSLFNAAVAQIESAIGSPAGVPLARRFQR